MTLKDIRPGLRAHLLGDSAIATIVGTRVYPVKAPQPTTDPTIVYTRISGLSDNHMQGPSGLTRPRFQIDTWASSADVAAQLANLIKERLDGFLGVWEWGGSPPENSINVQGVFPDSERDGYDSASALHFVSRDYFVHYEER